MAVECEVNGRVVQLHAPAMSRLLDVLRDELKLTGTKEGCGEGECGACSVIIDGALVNSCLVPVAQLQGAKIKTIESVAQGAELAPLQAAFIECGGAQCGICTPGMIMACVDLLNKNPHPNDAQIREGLAGNLCRCTGYTAIFDSLKKAIRLGASP